MSEHFIPGAATCTTHYNKHKRPISVLSVGFETKIAALERRQTCCSSRKAIGIGQQN